MNKKNNLFGLALTSALCLSMLTACSSSSDTPAATSTNTPSQSTSSPEVSTSTSDTSSDGTAVETSGEIVVNYPKTMQAQGYTDPIILEEMPSRVAVMTVAPVLALHELGLPLICFPSTTVTTWPDEMLDFGIELPSTRSDTFDIELIIKENPDFVVMGTSDKETFGAIMEDAGYPVYYVDNGHSVSYDSVKLVTTELIEAFGGEKGADLLARFDEVEKRMDSFTPPEENTVLVIQTSGIAHYLQSTGGTLGSMLDTLGFENVYDGGLGSMSLMDFEATLFYDPDHIYVVGGEPTAEAMEELMIEGFGAQQEYWDAIDAYAEGRVTYMPASFVSSAGITVIDSLNEIMDYYEG